MPNRILLAHNSYQRWGGEDIAFAADCDLLQKKGHEVIQYTENNERINTISKLDVVTQTFWSRSSYQKISELLKRTRPDIVHFHNIFPLISPAAYYACHDNGIPVVQSLHNYRLLCPMAALYRDGHICEDCLGKSFAWPGILHACYHESPFETAVIAGMLTVHRWARTWSEKVDIYLAGTDFMRDKFIQAGLPSERIAVRPNFISSPVHLREDEGDFALFVGRLVPEKGVRALLESWPSVNVPLKIVGNGPLQDEVVNFLTTHNSLPVDFLGSLDREVLQSLLSRSRLLIFPSEWYEAFPMIILDAFSSGVPVIASRLGAAGSVIRDNFSGLHFDPGSPADLAAKVRWAWDHPEELAQLGRNARHEYEEKYSAEKNYELLLSIYRGAILAHHKVGS